MAYFKINASLKGDADLLDDVMYFINKHNFDLEDKKGKNKYVFTQYDSTGTFQWGDLTEQLDKYFPDMKINPVSDIDEVITDINGVKGSKYEILNLEL